MPSATTVAIAHTAHAIAVITWLRYKQYTSVHRIFLHTAKKGKKTTRSDNQQQRASPHTTPRYKSQASLTATMQGAAGHPAC